MDGDERWRLIAAVASSLNHGSEGLRTFVDGFRRVLETEAWRQYPYPNGSTLEFASVAEFIEHPRGLNSDPAQVEKLIEDDPDLVVAYRRAITVPHGGDRTSGPHNSKTDNVSLAPKHGNSRAYRLDRLHREAPDYYQRVKDGELSVNRAMIESGLKRPAASIPRDVPLSDLAAVLRRRYSGDELTELQKLLKEEDTT